MRSPAPSLRPLLAAALLATILVSGCGTPGPKTGNAERFDSGPQELPAQEAAIANLKTAQDLERSGFPEQAIQSYELARRNDPSLDVSSRLAVLYDRMGETTKAREEYDKALRRHPNDPKLINDFGYFYYSRGQWKEAEHQFRRALMIDPGYNRAWTNLGLTLAQQDEWVESFEALEHTMTPGEARYNIGLILAQKGRFDEAEELLRAALEREPDITVAREVLQWIEEQRAMGGDVPVDRQGG